MDIKQTMRKLSSKVYLSCWIFIAVSEAVAGTSIELQQAGVRKEICEDGRLGVIDCDLNGLVDIQSVNYTVTSSDPCWGSKDKDFSAKAFSHLNDICNNKTKCPSYEVKFQLFAGANACSNDFEACLIVNYICKPVPVEPTTEPSGLACPEFIMRNMMWPKTSAGTTASSKCPNNAEAVGTWHCGRYGRWVREPNLQDCVSPSIHRLKGDVLAMRGTKLNATSLRGVLRKLEAYTEETLYGGDLQVLSAIISEIVLQSNETVHQSQQPEEARGVARIVSDAVLTTSSNLLKEGVWKDLPKEKVTSGAAKILNAVESSAFQLADTSLSSLNVTDNIVLQVQAVDVSKQEDLIFPPQSSLKETPWHNTSSSLRLQKETVRELTKQGKANIVFVMYKNMAELLPPSSDNQDEPAEDKELCQSYSNCTETARFVNSEVISASINSAHINRQRIQLPQEIFFTLQHNRDYDVTNATCAFWDYSEVQQKGDWSTEGCRLVVSNKTHTTCACSHLTSFAIIMSPTQPQISAANEFALEIITYFGLIISIVCLLLAFITFQAFKNLQCDRTTIHKNLCLCLLIANLVFVCGIQLYSIPVLCSIVAGILHYFFLASFAWMCLEGVQLYIMLIEVFEAEKSRVAWYYAAGYGVPAVIVTISAAVYHQGYGTDKHCWLSTDKGFVWAFIGPAIGIIVVNSFMLGVAIRAMIQHAKSAATLRMKEKTKLEQIRLWIKGTIVLVFLLGLTWLFGLMYISGSTVVFAYIFTILNTLQGLFIFIFHCLMNDKVQTEYRKFIRRTTCLPESFRNKYGEKSKSTVYSNTPNRNMGSSDKSSGKLGNQNRKSSEVTSLSKSTSSARGNNDNYHVTREVAPALVHAVDSGIDDPPSYTKAPSPSHAHHPGDDTEINGNSFVDEGTDDEGPPREPSTADYLVTIKDRRRMADSLSGGHTGRDIDSSSGVTGSYVDPRSREINGRHVSGSSEEDDDDDFVQEPERSLMKRKVERLTSVTAV